LGGHDVVEDDCARSTVPEHANPVVHAPCGKILRYGGRAMSGREGLIKTDELIELAKTLDGAAIVQLKKQELDYLIARVGLQGTLWGAWACLIAIVMIVVSPTFTSRSLLDGWQLVAIVAVMVISVVFYGAFIFQRALKADGSVGSSRFSLESSTTSAKTHPRIATGN
jgi:hypothetical protein